MQNLLNFAYTNPHHNELLSAVFNVLNTRCWKFTSNCALYKLPPFPL